ncbi:MAG: sigma-54-dependent Fis family transcriptional regulator [Blastocatellia bacterium]|nr:sigma-54-dependent Fis family transcriptional regulator [Blastocatellia bacterium]
MAIAWQFIRPAGADDHWHRRLDEAIHLVRSCRLVEAVRLADEAIAASPDDKSVTGRAHSFKGEAASIRGALDETMSEYALAIADLEVSPLAGSLARARRGRAEAYFNLAMYSSALEESDRAAMLVESIDVDAVRRRAELETAICEGLIRIELNQAGRARELWQATALMVGPGVDPLLVGLHSLLGGLSLVPAPEERSRGFALLKRASDHFRLHELPYYRARTLEAHARRLVGDDIEAAVELADDAAGIYARCGAVLRHARAQRWLEDVRPRRPSTSLPVRQTTGAATVGASDEVDGIVIAGPSTRGSIDLAFQAAATGSTVLITGESGTGKEQIARLIHHRSRRASRPWVAFNCATVPPDMIESILFGHRRGAFTGAHATHEGLVRAADGGTFFLDELGELPLTLQAKLLRFLQDGEILPLGETQPVRVDVRIVAATNRDLERETRAGRFRADLYHRLNVIRLQVAPLRERRDEVPVLARRLAAINAVRIGVDNVEVTAGAIGPLLAYDWPGNVRELSNVIERALALFGSRITRESVEASLAANRSSAEPLAAFGEVYGHSAAASGDEVVPLARAMDTFERAYLERVLGATNGNRSQAAKRLEVSLQRLRYRMRRLGMG